MSIPLYIVDAFAAGPYTGNPAAVCLLDRAPDERFMALTAAEMNLSETAFAWPEEEGYRLRWFTPETEVELCGHATLATAHALWASGRLSHDDPALFHTRSGLLTAIRSPEGGIILNFPAYELLPASYPGMASALGVEDSELEEVWTYGSNALAVLSSERAVRELSPDFAALRSLPVHAVAVTAKGPDAERGGEAGAYHFVSRFFAPAIGVEEDPVTGSAHAALAPYWSSRLNLDCMTGYQASRRGGTVGVRLEEGRVHLTGQAVTVVRGELLTDVPLASPDGSGTTIRN
ncbi:PhzF family phenazine biosynthesis protein [Paenibacillus spiritus]|uniref:PhzF family phenazine biosynthesis protein n=1 Tax=Paenibacillus spiritus TaxID=2496557 RepID=A0A5J5G5A9_9BACL|nr:PhzF family phenazine biosynthesis protein [Paenibacillus spiritus]KAA9002122.1 PhzF family phenazine biosynthesis protein [Paenibacillus spiritus]